MKHNRRTTVLTATVLATGRASLAAYMLAVWCCSLKNTHLPVSISVGHFSNPPAGSRVDTTQSGWILHLLQTFNKGFCYTMVAEVLKVIAVRAKDSKLSI